MKYLTITATLPNGHAPESYFRGQNVGVGGDYNCGPLRGGPVRRATQNELRFLDRRAIARMLEKYPAAAISFRLI